MAWKIERRAGTCRACERAFEDGERHASFLEVGEEGLVRGDQCAACWVERTADADEGESEGNGPTTLFWWFTHHLESGKKAVQLDLESLEQLFVQLEGRKEEPVRELRYVLCLLLMRKRRVKIERVVRSAEGESFQVKRPRREERFQVFVYDFTPERMAELRDELQAIFDGAESTEGLPVPERPEEQGPAEADEEADGSADTEDAASEAAESEAAESEAAESEAVESEQA
ncbi:MAG: hypothetical protein GY711_12170 [bacterium]|nr:hypothetical protein [bacterium]